MKVLLYQPTGAPFNDYASAAYLAVVALAAAWALFGSHK
jgi:hypothetical protein